MFTVSDITHLIRYYYHTSSYDNAATDVLFVLNYCVVILVPLLSYTSADRRAVFNSDIEKSLGVTVATPPLTNGHPNAPLYDAAQRLKLSKPTLVVYRYSIMTPRLVTKSSSLSSHNIVPSSS
jgi:hypothetical protein